MSGNEEQLEQSLRDWCDSRCDGCKKLKAKDEKALLVFSEEQDKSVWQINSESEELMKFMQNGDIYIRGKLIENDREVVQGMRDFLSSMGFIQAHKGLD